MDQVQNMELSKDQIIQELIALLNQNQQKEAANDITEPTEISVPAEQDTTRVIPIARIAISLPRFKISIIRPYNTPFRMEIVKKLNAKFPDATS